MRTFIPVVECRYRPVSDFARTTVLALYAFTAWSSPTLNLLAFVACLGLVLLDRKLLTYSIGDPLFRLGLCVGCYLFAQTLWGIHLFPETSHKQWQDFIHWWLLFTGFFAIAWNVEGKVSRINAMLIAGTLGLWVGMMRVADWDRMVRFEIAEQTGFMMTPACSSQISAATILGLMLLARFNPWHGQLKISRMLGMASLTMGFLMSGYMLISSQARITWIAFFLTSATMLALRYKHQATTQTTVRTLAFLGLILALLAAGVVANSNAILKRISPDLETASLILQGRVENMPSSSFKYRYHVLRLGLAKWLERPITGWGTGSTRTLIQSSGNHALYNEEAGRWMGHLHNTYLEILVRFGILGAVVISVFMAKFIMHIRKGSQSDSAFLDYRLFLGGCAMLSAIASVAEFPILTNAWRGYWFLLAGIAYGCVYHRPPALREGYSSTGYYRF